MRGERKESQGWEFVSRRRKPYRREQQNRVEQHQSTNAGWRLGTTFLFRNFPEGCRKEELWNWFSEIGKVEDLFLPAKRDKQGGRFGFVRLSKGGEDWEMLEGLNRIWIGSYIIRAFIPRHERGFRDDRVRRRSVTEEQTKGVRNHHVFQPKHRVSGVLYSEALRGKGVKCDGGEGEGEDLSSDLKFQSVEEEGRWLEGAVTGFLKKEFSWRDHGEEICSECVGSLRVTDMGGNYVLIQSSSNQSTKETLAGFDECLSFWFEWQRPWNKTDVNASRAIWTRWIGVPLHAWNDRFFKSACSKFGSFVELHVLSSDRARLDVALVKVCTGLDSVDTVLSCWIDGSPFRIRVEEFRCEELWPSFQKPPEEESVMDSDFSDNAEEELLDDGSVEAMEVKPTESQSAGEVSVGGGGNVSPSPQKTAEACAEIVSSQEDVAAAIIESDRSTVGGGVRESGVRVTPDCDCVEKVGPTCLDDEREVGLDVASGPEPPRPMVGLELSKVLGPENGAASSVSVGSPSTDLGWDSIEAGDPSLPGNQKCPEENSSSDKGGESDSPRKTSRREAKGMERRKGNRKWKKQARARAARLRAQSWDNFINEMAPSAERENRGAGTRKGGGISKKVGKSLEEWLGKEG